ncbi:unnamed protein product [Spirodela intermedia]|uniref:Uncharacterized protein n=1 Tax=Spirodela intermedia TaxID=51605 RepID=A0A7I8JNC4_SPIIN|nr:unnamed protein product [Spirodela intermedia]CAA6671285.1 unnamed protein product [Spirodela intermedia]
MAKKRLPISSSSPSLLLVLPSSSLRNRFWFGMKVVSVMSGLICLFTFLRIQSPFQTSSFYTEKNGDAEKFSIYIHSKPGFIFDASTTRSSYFYGRQLRESVRVIWGEASMVEAERLLLQAALEDPANQRFVLLSERCVPLYNFSYTYNYLMSSSKSFVDSFVITKHSRYNPDMFPTIPRDKWRKGSQWATLVRKHAVVVAMDNVVFPVFKKHCKMHLEGNGGSPKNVTSGSKSKHNCIPDEHYIQTLFSWTLESFIRKEKQDWHPITFEYADADPLHIEKIKGIDHLYFETEYRTEECLCNAAHVPCYLFARKFSEGAALRLLTDGAVGPFNPAYSFQHHNSDLLPPFPLFVLEAKLV